MDDNIKIEKHDNIKNEKQCIQIQEARIERKKKYGNTFTYYNCI